MPRTIQEMRERARRAQLDPEHEIPICNLVGNIPDPDAMEALRGLRRAGEIEQTDPGFWRLINEGPAE